MERYSLRRSIEPFDDPITLAQAKAHLSVSHDNDDTLIGTLIKAATAAVEDETNRALVYQQCELRLECFPDEIIVPRPPLHAVASVQYLDADGALQTLAASSYQVDTKSEPGRIKPAYGATWPVTRAGVYNAVVVTYWAGFAPVEVGSPTDFTGNLPPDLVHAVKFTLAEWYRNRENTVIGPNVHKLPQTSRFLCWKHRVEDARLSQ